MCHSKRVKTKSNNCYCKVNNNYCSFVVSFEGKKKCRIMSLMNYFLFALVVQLILCMIIDFLNHSSNLAYDRYLASALSLCDIQNCHIMICTISVEDNTNVLLKMKRMLLG